MADTLRCLFWSALVLPVAQATAGELTLERLFADQDLSGSRASSVQLSADGRLVTYLKPNKEDRDVLDLWVADRAGGEPFLLVDASALPTRDAVLSEAEKGRRERQRISAGGIVAYIWDEQGRFLLVPADGDVFLIQRAGGAIRRLTTTPGAEIDAKVSPRGRFVSYVRDQNLYVMELSSAHERALTSDGAGTVSWATAEFIAQEEMRRSTGYWWSPDERRIAMTRVDESSVDVVPRLDIAAGGAVLVDQRYPRAGRPNATIDLYVADLEGESKLKVDLGADPDIYVARVAWSSDSATVYVQRQSRDQKRLDLLAIDVASGASRVVLSETSAHWVELHDDFRPLRNGDFLWSSERSGFRHLYLYSRDGRLIRQVTRGEWPVDKIEGVDEARGTVLFAASKATPLTRHLYSMSYVKSAEPRQLTTGDGWWTVSVKGDVFAGTYSDPGTPPRTALYGRDGTMIRWLERNVLDATHPYHEFVDRLRTPQFGALQAADGAQLQYALWTPPDFDPTRKYPVIVSVYGGPAVQTVRKQWGSLTDQLLLEQGYVLFRLDNRGSANRDVRFKTAIHRRLGVAEVEDQLAGVRFLHSLEYVDPTRVAVMGWSYGGFMTLKLLTSPNAPFAAGIAGAGVTDWRLYDTHYTERFMSTPQENAAGYGDAEIVPALGRLKAELLLVHGMADDNVTFDQATKVMAALQARPLPFELMTYPGERHLLNDRTKQSHLWRLYLDFLRRKLLGPS